MKLLITAAAVPLAQSLAAILRDEHEVKLTERTPVAVAAFTQCALNHDPSTNSLVKGIDAIVHVAEPVSGVTESQQIDYATRCTYNLYLAAAEEGVKRIVLLSTLDLMMAYPAEYTVGERWRPLPTTDLPVLTKHLTEYVSREFAREHKLSVTVLRLGKVVRSANVAGQPFDPLWVDERDVAQAINRALTTETGRWSIFHIQSASPQARFSSATAQQALGYTPTYAF